MKQEGLKERVELLEIGEALGWPRLGYGRSTKIPHDKRIPQGQPGWEKFCAHAHVRRILPALRIGRVLRANNVQVFHPLTAAEMRALSTDTQGGGPDPTAPVQGVSSAAAHMDSLNPLPTALDSEEVTSDRSGLPPQSVTDLLEEIKPLEIPARRSLRGGHKATRSAARRDVRSQQDAH